MTSMTAKSEFVATVYHCKRILNTDQHGLYYIIQSIFQSCYSTNNLHDISTLFEVESRKYSILQARDRSNDY